jgi:hypothetical protein
VVPCKVVPDPEDAKLTIRAISYRVRFWAAVASDADDQARIMHDLSHPARVGDKIGVCFSGG